jgi:acetyltransferase
VDQRDHVALVAQVEREGWPAGDSAPTATPRLVADARYVRNAAQPDEAEFAIAVADDWQSLGLGRTLMARLAGHAHDNGIQTLIGDVLADNRRMIVLMRGLGARVRGHPDGPQLLQVVFDTGEGRAQPADSPGLAGWWQRWAP